MRAAVDGEAEANVNTDLDPDSSGETVFQDSLETGVIAKSTQLSSVSWFESHNGAMNSYLKEDLSQGVGIGPVGVQNLFHGSILYSPV